MAKIPAKNTLTAVLNVEECGKDAATGGLIMKVLLFGGSSVMSASGMIIVLILLLSVPISAAFAQSNSSQGRSKSLDPMNRPMDELGVTGKDNTLCSDRWYSCTTYDRQQFDQKYPGRPLNELLRFGEPDWPDRPRDGREWREKRDGGHSFGYHHRLERE